MEFYETVSRQRSVGEFQPRPVEAEKLRKVLEAGARAADRMYQSKHSMEVRRTH